MERGAATCVVMAIANAERLCNDAVRIDPVGCDPSRYQTIRPMPRLLQTGHYGDVEGRNDPTVLSNLSKLIGLGYRQNIRSPKL